MPDRARGLLITSDGALWYRPFLPSRPSHQPVLSLTLTVPRLDHLSVGAWLNRSAHAWWHASRTPRRRPVLGGLSAILRGSQELRTHTGPSVGICLVARVITYAIVV